MRPMRSERLARTAIAMVMASVVGMASHPATADDPDSVRATTEDGRSIIVFEDGTWQADEATDVDGVDPSDEEPEPEISTIALPELASRASELEGETITVSGMIRCNDDAQCEIVPANEAFYVRHRGQVDIRGIDRDQRRTLANECGRFDPRCDVTVTATVTLTRYDALRLIADAVELN